MNHRGCVARPVHLRARGARDRKGHGARPCPALREHGRARASARISSSRRGRPRTRRPIQAPPAGSHRPLHRSGGSPRSAPTAGHVAALGGRLFACAWAVAIAAFERMSGLGLVASSLSSRSSWSSWACWAGAAALAPLHRSIWKNTSRVVLASGHLRAGLFAATAALALGPLSVHLVDDLLLRFVDPGDLPWLRCKLSGRGGSSFSPLRTPRSQPVWCCDAGCSSGGCAPGAACSALGSGSLWGSHSREGSCTPVCCGAPAAESVRSKPFDKFAWVRRM